MRVARHPVEEREYFVIGLHFGSFVALLAEHASRGDKPQCAERAPRSFRQKVPSSPSQAGIRPLSDVKVLAGGRGVARPVFHPLVAMPWRMGNIPRVAQNLLDDRLCVSQRDAEEAVADRV